MAKNTNNIVTIEDFKVTNLAEFQGKKEQQEQLVIDNPFIEITDNESFITAKKHRTALVTARTSLADEKKKVAKRIKEIIVEPVSDAYDNLILITKPHEDKQQEEVKRYEAKKEEERLAKQRAEEERIANIKETINSYVSSTTNVINNLSFADIENFNLPTLENIEELQEYQSLYFSEHEALKFTFQTKKDQLIREEQNRLKEIELEKERKEVERKEMIRKHIFETNSYWNNAISYMVLESVNAVKKAFEDIKPYNAEEFATEYENVLAQIKINLDNKIQYLIQQEEIAKQNHANMIIQRRGILASIGFDYNTLNYSNFGLNLTINESELETNEVTFNSLLEATKARITEASLPKEEVIVETTPEIQEIQVQQEEIVQSPTNMTTFQEQPIVEPEQPQLTKNQIRSVEFLTKFIAYCNENISTSIEINISNFVLENVK